MKKTILPWMLLGVMALAYDQPIGFRWAKNLQPFDAPETRRFASYFDAAGSGTATMLAKASAASP